MTEPGLFLFLRLLAAHLLADFVLQPNQWIKGRMERGPRSKFLYYHIAVVGILTYLFIGDWSAIGLALFITVTHGLIDIWKSIAGDTTRNFLIDQAAHMVMLVIGWAWYSEGFYTLVYWAGKLAGDSSAWIIFISYVIAIWPLGFLIAKITDRWQREIADASGQEITGLKNAGMWIGRIERFIILTLVLLQQYSAIGFLIAAKSIFRFHGSLKDKRDRKEAEYILIGTLLSFALAIALGVATLYLLNRFC